jgi:hypothetical protein
MFRVAVAGAQSAGLLARRPDLSDALGIPRFNALDVLSTIDAAHAWSRVATDH